MVDPRGLGGCVELLVRRVGLREAEVLAYRGVEEVRLLRDDADEARQRREAEVADVDAADRDEASVDVVEPRCEVAEGRLPGAGLADERGRRPGGDDEAHVLQRPGIVAVAEPDAVEDDVAGCGDLDWVLSLGDVDGRVEVLEDPVEQRERGLDVEPDAEQRADGEEEPRLQRGERDDRRDRDRAAEDGAAEPVDRRRHDGEARLDRGHHPAARHPLPHLEVGQAKRLALEAVGELVAAPHRLPEQDPADRERLLDDARDVGKRLLRRLRDPPSLVSDPAREHREQRDQREREERKLPAQEEHADHRRDDRRHTRRDARRRVRDDVLHAADVVVDARLHLARTGAREEGQREALQVAEDGGAQVVHDALPDLVREQSLDDAEDAGDDRDHDHPGCVERDSARVVGLDRDQDAPEQERRHDAETGADDDQSEQPREPPPVRLEELPDPAHVRAPHLGVDRTLGRRFSPVVEEHPHQGRCPQRAASSFASSFSAASSALPARVEVLRPKAPSSTHLRVSRTRRNRLSVGSGARCGSRYRSMATFLTSAGSLGAAVACSRRWATSEASTWSSRTPVRTVSPIETELDAIIAQGRRVRRAPRATMRTIGVASMTTRWTLSDNSSESLPPASRRLPSAAEVTRSSVSNTRSTAASASSPTASTRAAPAFWVVVPAARPADVARARRRADRCSEVTPNTLAIRNPLRTSR